MAVGGASKHQCTSYTARRSSSRHHYPGHHGLSADFDCALGVTAQHTACGCCMLHFLTQVLLLLLLLQDIALLQDLLERLPTKESCEVAALWDALQVARHDCEVMAARGVRVTRDISRDWQETVSDLIDRVVAQDTELGQLRQQGKAAQASLGMEDQVVRLRRQRDSLLGDKQELSRILAASQEATRQAHREAAAAKVGNRARLQVNNSSSRDGNIL
eukprot:GHRR01037149.1.p1 GENE.GHRR01037149.1~~GHRR01037149.1.p1  ORF type:complete len:217 (+),score=93.20 GHRR01037149.1:462-1112(+)